MKFTLLTTFLFVCLSLLVLAPQSLNASAEVKKTPFAESLTEVAEKFKAADFENMSKRDQRKFMRSNMKDMVKHAPHIVKHQQWLTPRMKRGIYLVIAGMVISIIGSFLVYRPGRTGWGLYWLFYLIGSILITIGGIIILLELLESI